MARQHARVRAGDDRGSMAVEVVVLIPLLVMMMFLVVAFGRYVSAQGEVAAMARDAVRAATLERSSQVALAAAQQTAASAEPESLACEPATMTGAFVAGGQIRVEVRCDVSFTDPGPAGLGDRGRFEHRAARHVATDGGVT